MSGLGVGRLIGPGEPSKGLRFPAAPAVASGYHTQSPVMAAPGGHRSFDASMLIGSVSRLMYINAQGERRVSMKAKLAASVILSAAALVATKAIVGMGWSPH